MTQINNKDRLYRIKALIEQAREYFLNKDLTCEQYDLIKSEIEFYISSIIKDIDSEENHRLEDKAISYIGVNIKSLIKD